MSLTLLSLPVGREAYRVEIKPLSRPKALEATSSNLGTGPTARPHRSSERLVGFLNGNTPRAEDSDSGPLFTLFPGET